jgi:hypothetical protein
MDAFGLSDPSRMSSGTEGVRDIAVGLGMLGISIGCFYYAWRLKKKANS